MGNNFARLLPFSNDVPIVIPIRHDFCGATRFKHSYRRVLEGRMTSATFHARLDEINFITSDYAPSRSLALLPLIAGIVYLILYIIVLVERIGTDDYDFHPALTIIFMPFAVAVVQLLAWLWSQHQTEKLFTKIEKQLQIFNQKDNPKGILWRLNRELPMDHFENCSRVLCWSCYFPKLFCGIVVEFLPPLMSNNQQPIQPVMTVGQGLQPAVLPANQQSVHKTHSHHASHNGAGPRPENFMPTPKHHHHHQSGSGSGSGPSQQQFGRPASPQPAFLPDQKMQNFQQMQFPQPQHYSPSVFNQSQPAAVPSAPPAPNGALYPFDALGVSGSGYSAQTPNAPEEAPPGYKEKWQGGQ